MQEEKSYSGEKPVVATSLPMPSADQVRSKIRERLKALDLDLSEVSLAIGRNTTYLQQFMSGKQGTINENNRPALADILQIDERELRVEVTGKKTPSVEPDKARFGGAVRFAGKLHAFAHPTGGKYGQFPLIEDNRVEDVVPPASLSTIKKAYVVHVSGHTMEPRYRAGEKVYVNPQLPVSPGDYVVAIIARENGGEPDAWIKELVSKDDKRVVLRQSKPPKTFEFPANRVKALHAIILGGKG